MNARKLASHRDMPRRGKILGQSRWYRPSSGQQLGHTLEVNGRRSTIHSNNSVTRSNLERIHLADRILLDEMITTRFVNPGLDVTIFRLTKLARIPIRKRPSMIWQSSL
ncbi:hypothetical protein RRG08_006242 [Elysia crispata]|uniref:Uncharacterized protein n=1 Tax=Elysia crispata TaxID=231223 RepID=A0AAE1D2H3_9GAST|nr:hypothetical protein RRG08_006242 [Elysia crispata]